MVEVSDSAFCSIVLFVYVVATVSMSCIPCRYGIEEVEVSFYLFHRYWYASEPCPCQYGGQKVEGDQS